MYVKAIERLAGEFPMYALDTPGFGGSFDPEGMPGMTQYCAWIMAAIDALGIEKFHLFGHHTGACIGVEIAARHPARVAKLMMIGPVPLTQEEREEFRQHYSSPFAPTADGDYLKDTWDYLEGLGSNADLDLHHRELVDTARAYMGRYQIYTSVWDQDFPSYYAEVSCPILIMSAEDDVLNPYFERAKKLRPDAQATMLKGANFEPDLDPDGTVAAIRSFLRI
jgi:pimeloyl-ACP methyl ester carboxylesterase